MKIDWTKLISSVIICQAAGIIGGLVTAPNIGNWYASLIRPELSPPNWIFAPVWTFLYLTMGISLYLIWSKRKFHKKALSIFAVQLFFNFTWSLVFFGLHQISLALINLIILIAFIIITIIDFYKIDKNAGLILIPYLLWCLFATYLNYSLMILN